MLNCDATKKSFAIGVASDPKLTQKLVELSSKIETARVSDPKAVKRLQGDLESFVMSTITNNPTYRIDLIKRMKSQSRPFEVLNFLDDDGVVKKETMEIAERFGLSAAEVEEVIAKKIARDYTYSQKYGYESFYKRFGNQSKIDNMSSSQIVNYVKKEYDSEFLKQTKSKTVAEGIKKETDRIAKEQKINKTQAKEIAKSEYDQGLLKFMYDGEYIKPLVKLDPTLVRDMIEVASFIKSYDDVSLLMNGKSSKDIKSAIRKLKSKDEVESFILTNFKNLSKDDLLSLYGKQIELGYSLGQRQKSFLRGSMTGNIEGAEVALRARALGLGNDFAEDISHPEAIKKIRQDLKTGGIGTGRYTFSYSVDGIEKTVSIASAELLFKIMGFANLVKADTNFQILFKQAPGLRENIFGRAIKEVENGGENKIISDKLKEFFDITTNTDPTTSVFHEWFGFEPSQARYLDITIEGEQTAESKFINSFYLKNSSLIGGVETVSSIEDATKFLKQNPKAKIIVQDSRSLYQFPKEYRDRIIAPWGGTKHNYFVRNGNLYIGSRNNKFKQEVASRMGNVRATLNEYISEEGGDADVMSKLSELASEINIPSDQLEKLLMEYGQKDISNGYDILSSYKKSGFGRSNKSIDFGEKYVELSQMSNPELVEEANKILKKNGLDPIKQLPGNNRDEIIDGIMLWKYPDGGNPTLLGLTNAIGITTQPTTNKALLFGSLYEFLIRNNREFTWDVVESIVDKYLRGEAALDNDLLGTTADEINNLFLSIREAAGSNVPTARKEGIGLSVAEVEDIFASDVDMSIETLSLSKEGTKILQKINLTDAEVTKYKNNIVKEYSNLWDKYEIQLQNAFNDGLPQSKINDIKESFIVAMENFDKKLNLEPIGGLSNNRTGAKFQVYGLNSQGDFEQFATLKNSSIESFRNKLDAIQSAHKKALNKPKISGEIDPISPKNKLRQSYKNLPQSPNVDDLMGGKSIDDISDEEAGRLSGLLDDIKSIYTYYTNELQRYYELGDGMSTFFRDYKLVPSGINDAGIGVMLPSKLANEVRIPRRPGVNTAMVDMLTKQSILEKISNQIEDGLNAAQLNEIVQQSIKDSGGSLDDAPLYLQDFLPYTNLKPISDGTRAVIDSKLNMAKPEISPESMELIKNVIVNTENGPITIGELATLQPQEKMAQVMYGKNKVQTIEGIQFEIPEERLARDIQMARDSVEVESMSVDNSMLTYRDSFMKNKEDFIRMKSPKLARLIDLKVSVATLADNAIIAINNLMGATDTITGTFKKEILNITGATVGKADFSAVSSKLDEYMAMSSDEFSSVIRQDMKSVPIDDITAIDLATYFREIRDFMLDTFDDPIMRDKIMDIHKTAFQVGRGEPESLIRLQEEMNEGFYLQMMGFNERVVPGVQLRNSSYTFDGFTTDSIDRFNEVFGTNITKQDKGDIFRLISGFGYVPSIWGNSVVLGGLYRKFMNNYFTTLGRAYQWIASLTRYGSGLIGTYNQIIPQMFSYLYKNGSVEKYLGITKENRDAAMRWMIDTNLINKMGSGLSSLQSDSVKRLQRAARLSDIPAHRVVSGDITPSELERFTSNFTSIAGGAGNINDAIFAYEIMQKHVNMAVRTLKDKGYYYGNINEFIESIPNMTTKESKDLTDEIQARALRSYQEETGNSLGAQNKLVSTFANDTIGFLGKFMAKIGWGNNMVYSTFKNTLKTVNAIKYIVSGPGTVSENIDNLVRAIKNDPAFQIFWVNQISNAAFAAKFARVMDGQDDSEDENSTNDLFDMAMRMFNFISMESQGASASSFSRLFDGVTFSRDEAMMVNNMGLIEGNIIQIIENYSRQFGGNIRFIGIVPRFMEGYNRGGMSEGIKEATKFAISMSGSGMRYIYRQAMSDGSVAIDASYLGNRASMFLGNESWSRKNQDKYSRMRMFAEWNMHMTDLAKEDPDFAYLFYNKDGSEKTELQRMGLFFKKVIRENTQFFSATRLSSTSTQRDLSTRLTQNVIMKDYLENGYINVNNMLPDAKRELLKDVGQDVFGSQKFGAFNEGDTSDQAGGMYNLLENYRLGRKDAIKNKVTLKLLESLPESEINAMMDKIGSANTLEKRLEVEREIMSSYKNNPQMAWFFIAASADKEYNDIVDARKEQLKKANKKISKDDKVFISDAEENALKDAILEKYLPLLQRSDREWGTSVTMSAIIANESRNENSELKGLVNQKKDKNGNVVYDIGDRDFYITVGRMVDLQAAFDASIREGNLLSFDPNLAINSPMAQVMRYIPDGDLKVAFIKQTERDIDQMPVSDAVKASLRFGVLNSDPSLITNAPELRSKYGDGIWNAYVGSWFGLSELTDDVVNLYTEAAVNNGIIDRAKSSGGAKGTGFKFQPPAKIKVDLPDFDINKLKDIMKKYKFNSPGVKITPLDDSFKVSAKSLSSSARDPMDIKVSPIGDVNAKSNVYFKKKGGTTQSTSKRTKFTVPKRKLMKTKEK